LGIELNNKLDKCFSDKVLLAYIVAFTAAWQLPFEAAWGMEELPVLILHEPRSMIHRKRKIFLNCIGTPGIFYKGLVILP
tara:strand:+ start:1033 stop:1272 length:240 start_codon:yes stop_codon:yes gene_type:complete